VARRDVAAEVARVRTAPTVRPRYFSGGAMIRTAATGRQVLPHCHTIFAAVLLAAALLPQPSAAQTCFTGRPLPQCRHFFLTEATLMHRLDMPGGASFDESTVLGLGVGLMRNITPTTAVGVAGYLQTDTHESGGVLQVRFRHWLTDRFSLELAPGIGLGGGTGANLQAAAALADRVAVVVQVEAVSAEARQWSPVDRGVRPSAGVRLGGGLGVLGIVAALGLAGLAAATF
jgi:hypothetical protein